MRKLVSSESVTEGHPDKMCDQISDAVLDAYLAVDPEARVACEACATTGLVLVMGEVSSRAEVPVTDIVRSVITDIGYDSPDKGLDGCSCAVLTALHGQSPDIASGVNCARETRDRPGVAQETGAGDQGMMFGYACDETPEMLPTSIALAHRLTRRMSALRREGVLKWLRPDGKSLVTVEYVNGCPARVEAVVISAQHDASVRHETIEKAMLEQVVREVIPSALLDAQTKYFVNPSGRFVCGGPAADSGLTGRKIIVDTYGGCAPHGGGCFSGKDPTKVDRSAAYAARYVAKNIVAAGLARQCQISLAYAIGIAQPVGFSVDTFGSAAIEDAMLAGAVRGLFNLSPDGIIERFELRRPIYRQTACYGHFGRLDLDLPWEKTDMTEALLSAVRKVSGLGTSGILVHSPR